MIDSLTAELVQSGLVSRQDLDRALFEKTEHGGSLAVNLVLLGIIEEEALAEFFVGHFEMQRVSGAMLAAVDIAVFERLPLEVIYETGVLPLAVLDDDRLIVGVIDPSEEAGIDEAQFYAGVTLEKRVLTVSQLAHAFERLHGEHWKMPAAEIAAVQARLAAERQRMDEDLQELFSTMARIEPALEQDIRRRTGAYALPPAVDFEVTASAGAMVDADGPTIDLAPSEHNGPPGVDPDGPTVDLPRSSITGRLEVEVVDEADGPVVELVSSGASQRIHVEVVDEVDGPVVELSQSGELERLTAAIDDADHQSPPVEPSSIEIEPVADADGPVVELTPNEAGSRHPAPAQPREATLDHPASGSAREDHRSDSTQTLGSRTSPPDWSPPPTQHEGPDDDDDDWSGPGRATTVDLAPSPGPAHADMTPAVAVPAVLGTTSSGDFRQERMSRADLPIVDDAGRAGGLERLPSGGWDVPPSGREEAASSPASARPEFLTPAGDATTGAAEGRFAPAGELVAAMGEPDAPTMSAVALAMASLESVADRDEVARQVCEALSFVYPNVVLLSPRLPNFVVWDAELAHGAERSRGLSFASEPGSMWHHVTRQRIAFFGSLRTNDPLRVRLGAGFGREALVIPVCMNKRTVALLVLNSGPTTALAPPGPGFADLSDVISAALRRVILRGKRSPRPV